MLESFSKKVEDFNSLIINDKLIMWEEDSPKVIIKKCCIQIRT